MKRVILPGLLSFALALAEDDAPRTIVTSDGVTYTQARVTELRPSGVAISTEAGIAVVPYNNLPTDLQARYRPNAKELANAIGTSLDGLYEMPPERTGFGGERLILRDGRFVFQWVSDVSSGGELRGRFTRSDHWITFHHREFASPDRVLTILNGKLTILHPEDFKAWRDTGNADYIMHVPLHRTNSP